jgi:hypothetical protein
MVYAPGFKVLPGIWVFWLILKLEASGPLFEGARFVAATAKQLAEDNRMDTVLRYLKAFMTFLAGANKLRDVAKSREY